MSVTSALSTYKELYIPWPSTYRQSLTEPSSISLSNSLFSLKKTVFIFSPIRPLSITPHSQGNKSIKGGSKQKGQRQIETFNPDSEWPKVADPVIET